MVESPDREADAGVDRREGLHPCVRPGGGRGSPRDVAMVCRSSGPTTRPGPARHRPGRSVAALIVTAKFLQAPFHLLAAHLEAMARERPEEVAALQCER